MLFKVMENIMFICWLWSFYLAGQMVVRETRLVKTMVREVSPTKNLRPFVVV